MNPVDNDRLQSKTGGATIINIDAYRAASDSAGMVSNTQSYVPPHAWSMIVIAVIVLCVFFFLKRA